MTSEMRFNEWLSANREFFRFKSAPEPLRQIVLLKPFSEFVLVLDLLRSYGRTDDKLKAHMDWAWEEVEQGGWLLRLLAARPDLFQLAQLFSSFERWGYKNQQLEMMLIHISRLRSIQSIETEAWIRQGFQHAMASITKTKFDCGAVTGTWLGAMPEPWCINDGILYSVTHEVFYASDFGRSACSLPDAAATYLRLWTPSWCKYQIERRNWDLTAELIMVLDCLDACESWETDPLPLLLSAQDTDGHVPGPAGAGSALVDARTTAAHAVFLSTYHTTLVSMLAQALRGSRNSARVEQHDHLAST